MAHVFISYIRENCILVDRLRNDLAEHGIEVWLDRDNIDPGVFWEEAIRKAINEGKFFLACFSDEYNSRHRSYMNEELTLAIEELRKRSSNHSWFIPVLFSGAIPDRPIGAGKTLRSIQRIELNEETWGEGISRLVEGIKAKSHSSKAQIQHLIALISSPVSHFTDIEFALKGLLEYGEGAVEAVPSLVALLGSKDHRIYIKAVEVLRSIGTTARDAVPMLIEQLQNGSICEASVCVSAITKALAAIAPDDKHVIAALIDKLNDPSISNRNSAALALGEIGPSAKVAVSSLIEILHDDIEEVHTAAVIALGKIRASANVVVSTLRHKLAEADFETKREIIITLGRFGPDARDAVPTLLNIFRDIHSPYKDEARYALLQIAPDSLD